MINLSPADRRKRANSSWSVPMSKSGRFLLNEQNYIIRVSDGHIVGRCGGSARWRCWYQLAAKPYDNPLVNGWNTPKEAFKAACKELEK